MKSLKTPLLNSLRAARFLWRGGPACRISAPARIAEGSATFLLLAAATLYAFKSAPGNDARTYLLVPPLLWTVLRFGPRGALIGTLLVSLLATAQTTLGAGPFSGVDPATRMAELQGFVAVVALCSLGLAVLVEDLRKARGDAASSHERLDALLRRMPGLFWTVDRDMKFTTLRGTMAETSEPPMEQLLGMSLFDFFQTRDPDFPALSAHAAALAGRPAEYRQLWQDRTYQCRVDPLRDADGRITGTVGMAQDITVDLEAEEQHQRLQKMDALARLAGRVAHDFNNALTAILGYCDLLAGDFEPDDPRKKDIASIEKAALRAAATSDRLTAFSPHRANEARPVDLNALIQEFDGKLGEILGPSVARVYRLEPALPLVRLDPAQIREVLRQLASNAREAMPEGGQLVISTQRRQGAGSAGSPSPEGSHARISVQDTGPGLSGEARAHLFEPYYSTRSQEKDKGLGLATSYGLVRQNGGEISVRSAAGKGAAFHLDFPLWAGEASLPVAAAVSGGPAPRGTETLLLAEDDDSVREPLARVLENLGYTVLAAADGEAALKALGSDAGRRVRLLLSDIVMPGMNGVDLSRRVSTERPEVRRLLMSGYAERSLTIDGTLPPGTTFIQKPFSYPALARRIRQILDAPASSDLLI